MFSSQEYLDNKEDIDKFFNTIKGKGYRALDGNAKRKEVASFLKDRTALSEDAASFIYKVLDNARRSYNLTTLEDVIRSLKVDPSFEDVAVDVIKDKNRVKVSNIIERVGKLNKNTDLDNLHKWVDRVLGEFSFYKSIMHNLIDAAVNNGFKTTGEFVEEFDKLLTLHRPQGRI